MLLLLLRARGEEVHEAAAPASSSSLRARVGLAAFAAAVVLVVAKVEAVVCEDAGEAGDGVHVEDVVQVEPGWVGGGGGIRLLLLRFLLRYLIGVGKV